MKPIYLDYNATTPADPLVVEAMLPYFTTQFGNPANTLNSYGWAAENAVKVAAQSVANWICCKPQELTWNAGATEGNNSVVFGLIHKLRSQYPTEPIHFLTASTEHLSVLNSFKAAARLEKIEVDFIKPNSEGVVSVDLLKKYIKPHTKLVSLMWINNEIGSINPISDLAGYCHENKIYFHTDATQALGKVTVDLNQAPVHFLTFSAHKFYGPKGVGCLFVRSGDPYVEIEPYIFGGGQQRNQRSGTLNVPAIVGVGKAAELCQKLIPEEQLRTSSLLEKLYQKIKSSIPEVQLNGPPLQFRSPMNLSLTFSKPIDLLLPKLASLAFSQGSACSTAGVTSSHVLAAIGLSSEQAQRTLRLSLGRWTTESEINQAAETLIQAFSAL